MKISSVLTETSVPNIPQRKANLIMFPFGSMAMNAIIGTSQCDHIG